MTAGARDTGRQVTDAFVQRLLTIPAGACCPVTEADWIDTVVLVAHGGVEVEGLSGSRQQFTRGDLLWLTGLPVRALHNTGTVRAVLVAVSRRRPACGSAAG
jgi:hypothetical protein